MAQIILYEEYKFVEKKQNEVHGAWKARPPRPTYISTSLANFLIFYEVHMLFKCGTLVLCIHLLLFFLAFVFGSFCTFCFHMLMYIFEDKCILFPKLLTLNAERYDFVPSDSPRTNDYLPVDFVSTQWLEESHCYLPTFVPLISGIFGLIWTTMFLMCSTGSSTLTGLQRPWRILFPIFVFSVAISTLCLYTTIVTQNGLMALCMKLAEITGSSECTFTVNVATLLYERRVKGVYQAIVLTIMAAWLHTCCWIMSAVVIIIRVVLAVDFHLIRISAVYNGPFDSILINGDTPDASKSILKISSTEEIQKAVVETIHLNRKKKPPSDFSYITGKKSSGETRQDIIKTSKHGSENDPKKSLQYHLFSKSVDTFVNLDKNTAPKTHISQEVMMQRVGFEMSKAVIASKDLIRRLMYDDNLTEPGSDDADFRTFKKEHQPELNKLKQISAVSLDEVVQKFLAAKEKDIITMEYSKQRQDTGVTASINEQSTNRHTASQTVAKKKQYNKRGMYYGTCDKETEVEKDEKQVVKDEKYTQITKDKQD